MWVMSSTYYQFSKLPNWKKSLLNLTTSLKPMGWSETKRNAQWQNCLLPPQFHATIPEACYLLSDVYTGLQPKHQHENDPPYETSRKSCVQNCPHFQAPWPVSTSLLLRCTHLDWKQYCQRFDKKLKVYPESFKEQKYDIKKSVNAGSQAWKRGEDH